MLNAFRRTSIRDLLIKFDEYYRHIRDRNLKGYVFVYLDESYVHQTHAGNYSYCTVDDKHVNRSAGKGRQLIILHDITEKGPLCELDNNEGRLTFLSGTKILLILQKIWWMGVLPVRPCGLLPVNLVSTMTP
jgi:hypothetical protein